MIIAGGGWLEDGGWFGTDTCKRSFICPPRLSPSEEVYFHILNYNNKLVAVGGVGNSGWESGNPSSNSVEEWNPSTSTWSKLKTGLEEERASFGAVVVSKKLVCGV